VSVEKNPKQNTAAKEAERKKPQETTSAEKNPKQNAAAKNTERNTTHKKKGVACFQATPAAIHNKA
jgi:hypothetical protein